MLGGEISRRSANCPGPGTEGRTFDASRASHTPVGLPGWVSVLLAGSFGAGPKGPIMAITINREQRDAIYQEVVLDLNGLTDLWTEFDDGNFDRARELRDRFVLDMQLLDDLGWEPEQEADEFSLTMDGVEAGPTIETGLALPAPRVSTEAVQTPARVNVTCVTPLGEEVASTS